MRIRTEIHRAFLAWLVMTAASLPLHGNLVPNGNFEKEDNGTLAAWMPQETIIDAVPNNVNGISNGYADMIWDTASCGGGKGSVKGGRKVRRVALSDAAVEKCGTFNLKMEDVHRYGPMGRNTPTGKSGGGKQKADPAGERDALEDVEQDIGAQCSAGIPT